MTPRGSRPQPGAGQWKQGEYGTVAVTGATGFIGAHLVAKLAEHGELVRVLVRDTRRLANLVGLDVEVVRTDLADRDAVREALKGCGLLFHVAGEISGRDRERLWAINSFTPAAVVEAAAAVGVQRVVVTSTASAVGPAPGGEQTTEESPYRSAGFLYVDSKQAGETAALDAGQRAGVDVVISNPTYCLGNALNTSTRGAPSTRLVGNYVRGRLPAVIDTYNNFVDVEDVATGHLLAARYGKAGHRYLLGSQDLTWTQFIRQLRQVHDTRQPIVVLPRGIERVAEQKRLLGLRNPLPREAIRLMARDWKYSSDKATSELGYHPRPIDESVARTVAWYRQLCAEGAFPHDGGRRQNLVRAALRLVERTPLAGGRGPLTFV